MYFISRYSKLMDAGLSLSPWARWAISAFILFFITAGWYFLAYGTLQAQLAERVHQEHLLFEQQAVCSILNKKAEQLDAAVSAEKQAWHATVQKAHKQAGHDRLFSLFDAFGKQGVVVQAYYPQSSIEKPWYTKMSAQLHVTAPFHTLVKLFDALNAKTLPYQCEHIRLERRDNQVFAVITVSYKIPKDTA